MHTLFTRLILAALAALPLAVAATPRPDRTAGQEAAPTHATAPFARRALPSVRMLEALCDDTALRTPGSELRALIIRRISDNYYVGLSAQKSWRPLENFGDCDNKLRVYNPKVGVAVSYRF